MIKITQDINLENYTLILPSVAVGNVGQLAIDLLISNLNLKKIGQILSASFVPIAGANAYHETSNELITAIDIYAGIKECIIVIQIRSPYVNGLLPFFNELTQFIAERKIIKVIILASSYDYEKKDNQLQDDKLRYVASSAIHLENAQLFKKFNWIQYKPNSTSDISGEENLRIPGGGFAKSIFNFLSNANIPSAILLKFCSEGDNIIDAIALLRYLNEWLDILKIDSNASLKYPPSWKHLFGKPPPYNIY